MSSFSFNLSVVASMAVLLTSAIGAENTEEAEAVSFTVQPIGHVRQIDGKTVIVLDKKYEDGLLGVDQWSHVQVIWWFDKNDTPEKRSILRVHPRGNSKNPLTGVFACRAPFRPNLIALSLCKVVGVKDNVLEIEKIDAFPDTPVLDIKPFAPGQDFTKDFRVPQWAGPR